MKHTFFSLALFSVVTTNLYAQSDFRDGYIVKNDNDTLYGLIDYRGNIANSKKCIYKESVNAEKQVFSPGDLKAYRFTDGKYYVSKAIELGKANDLVFLEYLINGIVDIYYYRDLNTDHYLIDKGDGVLLELKNDEREVIVNGETYLKNSNEYIGRLKYIFMESPSVSKKVEGISLDSKSLIKIAKDYHNEMCTNEACIIYEKKMPKMKVVFGFGPLVGLSVINVSINQVPDNYDYLKYSNFSTDYAPSAGFFIKAGMPNLNKNLHLEYSGSFSKWNTATHNSYIEPVNNMTYTNDISLKQNSFNNALHVKYEYARGKYRPTLKLGFFKNYFFNTDSTRELDLKWSWGETYYNSVSHENPFSKSDYGISMGAGVIREISKNCGAFLDFKYQRGAGLLSNINLKDQYTDNFSLSFGIQFGK